MNPKQQIKFKHQAETRRYMLGEIIWGTDSPGDNGTKENSKSSFLVISGKVRLVLEQGDSVILQKGDWLGDLLELSGSWKARVSSKNVVILRWDLQLWTTISSPDIKQFWVSLKFRYQPQANDAPQPVLSYPFVSSLNTAAACLTTVTQYLQSPAQLE